MRKLVMLLLLAVFFLTGMVLGAQQGSINPVQMSDEEVEVAGVAVDVDSYPEIVEEPAEDNNIAEKNQDQSRHITQKVAGTIENAGIWFYNQVIDVAYGISQLFI